MQEFFSFNFPLREYFFLYFDISRTLKEKDNFTSCSRLRFKILTPELLVRFAYPSYKKQNASGKTTIVIT